MNAYPRVLSEEETLDRLVAGASIARFGDGELKICCGGATRTHLDPSPKLVDELREILVNPAPRLMPAIPHPRAVAKRWASWDGQSRNWAKLMSSGIEYGSAFVGRPKVAPWVETPEHKARFRDVWRGRPVIAVAPPAHPIARWLAQDATVLEWIECPALEAYSAIDELERRALKHCRPGLVAVICAGPAAKPLANRLAWRGVQSIDLGRGAGFIYK